MAANTFALILFYVCVKCNNKFQRYLFTILFTSYFFPIILLDIFILLLPQEVIKHIYNFINGIRAIERCALNEENKNE